MVHDPEMVEKIARAIWEGDDNAEQSSWGYVTMKDRGGYKHQALIVMDVLGLRKETRPEYPAAFDGGWKICESGPLISRHVTDWTRDKVNVDV